MKKLFNKIVAIVMGTALITSIPVNVHASVKNVTDLNDSGVTYEELQVLFPDLELQDNWQVGGVHDNLKISDTKNVISTYSAQYEDGECMINILSNGTYEIYGYEECEDNSKVAIDNYFKEDTIKSASLVGSGYSHVSGSTYKSYYRSAVCGFSYKFSISTNSRTGYSSLSSLTSPTSYGNQYSYFVGADSGYIRSKQTSSKPAEVYGNADMYTYNGGPAYVSTFTLTTKVTSEKIAVTVSSGITK